VTHQPIGGNVAMSITSPGQEMSELRRRAVVAELSKGLHQPVAAPPLNFGRRRRF
jgi:hypothetical protein